MVSIPIITSDQGKKGKKKGKNSQLSANNKDPALNNASNSKKKLWLSRIIVLWNEDIMAVQLLSAIDRAVPPKVLHIELRISFTATVSANRSDTREHLWAELTSLSISNQEPRILFGDFNVGKNDTPREGYLSLKQS